MLLNIIGNIGDGALERNIVGGGKGREEEGTSIALGNKGSRWKSVVVMLSFEIMREG